MDYGTIFILVSGFWGLAMIVNFVDAIRLCYAVENRSGISGRQKWGLPTYANIWAVAMNRGVAQDNDTQELRRQMNRRLLIILGGFVFFALFITLGVPDAPAA
ncbi:MAG: hypothetical protein JJ911_19870 [Rhizobiaceae bacterium]|jgi:hypothetical protein|nr:hypothetical protein [Rhizobiaceae bacterium]